MKSVDLLHVLSRGLEQNLRYGNPWWRGEPISDVPEVRRWAFDPVLASLKGGLTPATVLRGPRQVGKTILLIQCIQQLLAEGVQPHRIFRVQFDELPELKRLSQPILELSYWFAEQVLHKSFNQAAAAGERAYLFFDEVQNLPDWAPQLKNLVDLHPVRVLVTGSSALRIEVGRDSLAGRITTLEMGPLFLREIGALRRMGKLAPLLRANESQPLGDKGFWLEARKYGEQHKEFRQRAFQAFSERGAYPKAQIHPETPWEEVAAMLNETVIRRALQHDLRLGPRGQKRDEVLLSEVFRLACRYVGQSPSPGLYLDEIRRAMHGNIGWQRVMKYLQFLDGTLLIRLIEPMELRLKRRRGAPKLCLCDHALRAAWLQEVVPLTPEALNQTPHLADLAGRIAESVVGYFFRSLPNLEVAHFSGSATEPEVDFVLTLGVRRIPVEVKYRRRVDFADTQGLRAFLEKTHYHAPFGVLVTLEEETRVDDPRIVALPLSSLLLIR